MEKEIEHQKKVKQVVWNRIADHTQQPHQKSRSKKTASYWMGCLVAPIASSIVFPYAKKFGADLTKSWHIKNTIAQRLIPNYFAVTGLMTVSALGMTVCGKVFSQASDTLWNTTNNHLAPKSNDHSKQTLYYSGLGLSVVAGAISASQTSYLTLEYFQSRIGRHSIPLGVITQLTWTTIQAWSLYALPSYIFSDFKNTHFSVSEVERKRAALLTRLNENQNRFNHLTKESKITLNERIFGLDHARQIFSINEIEYRLGILFEKNNTLNLQQTKVHQTKLKKYVGWLGAATGLLGSYFFYPLGRLSGESFAKLMKRPQSRLIPNIFSISTFLCNAMLSAYATQDCYEKFYLNVVDLYETPTHETPLKKISPYTGLTALLALSACAHRVSIVKRFVAKANKVFAFSSVAASFMSLFCINFWAIDGLRESMEDALYPDDTKLLESNLNTVKEAITLMEEEYVNVMYECILQSTEISLTSKSLKY